MLCNLRYRSPHLNGRVDTPPGTKRSLFETLGSTTATDGNGIGKRPAIGSTTW
jgi:hypothetical protein